MIDLPKTPALLNTARRCVWFEAPEAALDKPLIFIAHVLTFGGVEDVAVLRRHLDDGALTWALDHAPPGIFDPRSWAYWNLVVGRDEPPPLPRRRFDQGPIAAGERPR